MGLPAIPPFIFAPQKPRPRGAKTADKTAAVLTVHRAPDMTKPGRRKIAAWLRRLADDLEQHGELFAKKLIARYRFTDS